MLSDKIKGKSALKAQTFLRERDKVQVGCLCIYQRKTVQATCSVFKYFLKPFIGEMFTFKKHSIHQNSSAMV